MQSAGSIKLDPIKSTSRSLIAHVTSELARSKQLGWTQAILACDPNDSSLTSVRPGWEHIFQAQKTASIWKSQGSSALSKWYKPPKHSSRMHQNTVVARRVVQYLQHVCGYDSHHCSRQVMLCAELSMSSAPVRVLVCLSAHARRSLKANQRHGYRILGCTQDRCCLFGLFVETSLGLGAVSGLLKHLADWSNLACLVRRRRWSLSHIGPVKRAIQRTGLRPFGGRWGLKTASSELPQTLPAN